MDYKNISVNIGEMKLAKDPKQILVAHGLGSCVAVVCYCPISKIGGMIHIILPELNSAAISGELPTKYANCGVPLLIEEMVKAGAKKFALKVKIAGGAKMLASVGVGTMFNIGEKNVISSKKILETLGVRIVAEDTGGTSGRTIRLYVDSGKVTIKSTGQEERML